MTARAGLTVVGQIVGASVGGALGAVSERELALLESTLGALDSGQSPPQLKAQLAKVKESVQRWQAASASATPVVSHGTSGAPADPAGGVRVFNPATGRLEPK